MQIKSSGSLPSLTSPHVHLCVCLNEDQGGNGVLKEWHSFKT